MLTPVLLPFENLLYRICGVEPGKGDELAALHLAMLLFNLVGGIALFAILLLQGFLPLNPQQMPAFSWHLALNTAVSFMTNTNWQNYSGEQAASYFTQMFGFAVQNFVSAATGMAIAIALIRGLVRRKKCRHRQLLGGPDPQRALYPAAAVADFRRVSGVPRGHPEFRAYRTVPLLQLQAMTSQVDRELSGCRGPVTSVTIPMGPVASQEAIKELGTNGGGFFNANSAHPFENPTPLTNLVEILLILLISGGLTYTFGVMAGNPRQGWALLAVMLAVLVLALRPPVPGRAGRQPAGGRPGRVRQQHGREGGALRPGRQQPVHGGHHRHLLRRSQHHARLADPHRRDGPALTDPPFRGDFRRGRHRSLHHAGLRDDRGLRGGTDDRPDPRVPRQEDRGP